MKEKYMKHIHPTWSGRFALMSALFIGAIAASGQGVITFENGSVAPGNRVTDYYEQGMEFHTLPPPVPVGPYHLWEDLYIANPSIRLPYNPTPYLEYTATTSDEVAFYLTSGSSFGLTSVDLAGLLTNPVPAWVLAFPFGSPDLPPVTFTGTKADGSMISQTFSLGAFMQTYYFNADFTDNLISVSISGSRWAMDNLVFVPEPGTPALIGLGLLAGGWTRWKRRRGA